MNDELGIDLVIERHQVTIRVGYGSYDLSDFQYH